MPNYNGFSFSYEYYGTGARVGKLVTPNGVVETPAFIFCGTKAAVKGLTAEQLRECKTQIILSNTYHLMLSPGSDRVKHFGGLQKFTGWRGPMFTDSGGYQIFSLGHGSVAEEIKGNRGKAMARNNSLLKIDEHGAVFRSYVDGSKQVLTPERSIQVQNELGADLIVVLDECTPFHVEKSYTRDSMRRSHRWAVRSLEEFKKIENCQQALYGITQGGIYPELRDESCDFINQQPFFAHAIGGSLGANKSQMHDIVAYTASKLVPERPIHLLGIGGISDIFNGVLYGIDTFDCVHPTRLARHGGAIVKFDSRNKPHKEHLNLNNAEFRLQDEPLEPDCLCPTCKNYTRGYIHYLLKAKEMTACNLLTIHNIYAMNALMTDIRNHIKTNTLEIARKLWLGH